MGCAGRLVCPLFPTGSVAGDDVTARAINRPVQSPEAGACDHRRGGRDWRAM